MAGAIRRGGMRPAPLFTEVPRRGVLGSLYPAHCIAPVEYHLIDQNLFTRSDLYAPPQHVDPSRVASVASEAILATLGGRSMHDPANELRRTPLLGTSVNRGAGRIPPLLMAPAMEQLCYGVAAQFQVPHLGGRLLGSPLAFTHWLVSHTRPVLAPP